MKHIDEIIESIKNGTIDIDEFKKWLIDYNDQAWDGGYTDGFREGYDAGYRDGHHMGSYND